MVQNSFFLYVIECKAIQVQANANHQKCLCGKLILLKLSKYSLQASSQLSERVKFSIAKKICFSL